jgi:hypothetical protein
MKKVLKGTKAVLIIGIGLIGLMILISAINHQIQLKKEEPLFIPIGKQVEVNGYKMNVYSEGEGEETLVFMSGSGTCSPVLDFKSLYSLLSDDYRIVVVEKLGYGFSDVTDADREIDSILSDTREALSLSGIQGPFILCPHSMLGIEALYWAQNYPNEVRAIIGLDMDVPKVYENFNVNKLELELIKFTADIGIARWIPDLAKSDATEYGTLSESEKELYQVVFFRRTGTREMVNEVKEIKENAQLVAKNPVPSMPILMFCSNGEDTGVSEEKWHAFSKDYLENKSNGKRIELDCSHYVHDIMYQDIAEDIKEYIAEIE